MALFVGFMCTSYMLWYVTKEWYYCIKGLRKRGKEK